MRSNRDTALHALYQASAALDSARMVTTDPILVGRIREIGKDVLSVIGKLATNKHDEVAS